MHPLSNAARRALSSAFNLEMLERRQLLAAGTLDLTFGTGGKVLTDFTSQFGGIARNAMVVQTDEKIIAVGDSQDEGGRDFAVARFNPNGTPDLTFGDAGTVTTDFSQTDSARGVALQSDGKIVVVGYKVDPAPFPQNFVENFAVARYNTDGSLDTSFGSGGKVFTNFGADSIANAVAIQGDGKIVVAGGENNVDAESIGAGTNIAIARYNTNGTLDGSFGSAGVLSTYAPSRDDDSFQASALAIQPDGKLVIAGFNDTYPLVARFQSNGDADLEFGAAGYVIDPFGDNSLGRAFGVTVQSDGKVVFAGALGADTNDAAVGRLMPDGATDTGFGDNGYVWADLGSDFDRATGVALQSDGKIVLSAAEDDNGELWSILRYDTDGAPDGSFGIDGVAEVTGIAGITAGNTVAVQSDGKIVSAGQHNGVFEVARLSPSGLTDTSFGTAGIATNSFLGSRSDTGRSLAIQQADGKLVVVGATLGEDGSAVAIARYNTDGSLDVSFGNGGRVLDDTGPSKTANAVAIDSYGKIVIAGQQNSNFLIARYNTNGTLDTTFATTSGNAFAIAIQPDGKIVAVGSAVGTGGTDFAVARYNANGTLDGTFSGGKVTTAIGAGSGVDVANAVVVQPDGKIVAAGRASGLTGNDFALVRYNANGSVDTSGFNAAGLNPGTVTASFGSFSDIANAIALQSDGGLVVAGQAGTSTGSLVGLARFLPNGTPDNSFDVDGRATIDITAGTSDVAGGVVVQPGGKIVIAASSNGDFALARVNANGSTDSTFGTAGQVTTDFGPSTDSANSLVMQADGKFVAIGTSRQLGSSDNDFALARYLGDNAAPTAVANGPYSVNEGGNVALSSAGSSDPDQSAGTLTYTWDLDGDNVFGETGGSATRGNETGATPTFNAANLDGPSSVNVKLRVTDSFGESDTTTAVVNVSNVPPAVGAITAPTAPVAIGATVNASASFTDAGTLDTHTASWNWGDTTSSAGTVTESNGAGNVTGSHAYSAAGTYTVTLTVTDDDGDSAQSVFQFVTVVVVNQAPTAVANGPYSVVEGGTVALSSAGSSDPDQSAGTLTYTWDLDGDNVFGEAGETGQSPTFSAANLDGPSSVNVKLRVTDSFGASDNTTAVVNVTNATPTVGAVTAPLDPQLINTSINASASFADAGKLDTHTATWKWGDTTTSAGAVTESNGTGSVTGSHQYTTAGVYTVTLTVMDDDGATKQSVFEYVVIYNPVGGFVTGGGTINSPAGAMPGNPTATGVANFAFNSKYHNGSTVPDGDTKFRFSVGNFEFNSDSYDWMVISGAKVRYRGTGKVNGAGNYGFEITAIDGGLPGGGGVDRFRIKIWNKSAGNAIVYDNQMGLPDGDDPVTALLGGAIKIHK